MSDQTPKNLQFRETPRRQDAKNAGAATQHVLIGIGEDRMDSPAWSWPLGPLAFLELIGLVFFDGELV